MMAHTLISLLVAFAFITPALAQTGFHHEGPVHIRFTGTKEKNNMKMIINGTVHAGTIGKTETSWAALKVDHQVQYEYRRRRGESTHLYNHHGARVGGIKSLYDAHGDWYHYDGQFFVPGGDTDPNPAFVHNNKGITVGWSKTLKDNRLVFDVKYEQEDRLLAQVVHDDKMDQMDVAILTDHMDPQLYFHFKEYLDERKKRIRHEIVTGPFLVFFFFPIYDAIDRSKYYKKVDGNPEYELMTEWQRQKDEYDETERRRLLRVTVR